MHDKHDRINIVNIITEEESVFFNTSTNLQTEMRKKALSNRFYVIVRPFARVRFSQFFLVFVEDFPWPVVYQIKVSRRSGLPKCSVFIVLEHVVFAW